jgi:hypothetical protein
VTERAGEPTLARAGFTGDKEVLSPADGGKHRHRSQAADELLAEM